MGTIKRVWHDPVWSKVISAAILYAIAQLARHWPPGVVTSINRWFEAPITLTRGDLVIWPLQTVSGIVAIYAAVLAIRFELARRRVPAPVEPQADAQLPEAVDPKPVPQFEPDKFDLTGSRCRALLALLERVDARNTLHELYQFVIQVGPFVDRGTSKGQLQHDMEEAERLGIVSIDRVSPLTHCYSLTAPEGRDWVLRNKAKLQARAPLDMERTDPRAPYG